MTDRSLDSEDEIRRANNDRLWAFHKRFGRDPSALEISQIMSGEMRVEVPVEAPSVAAVPEIEIPTDGLENEPPKDFSGSSAEPVAGGAVIAENLAQSALTAAQMTLGKLGAPVSPDFLVAYAGVMAQIAIARAIREQTAAQAAPPQMWRVDGQNGKMERVE